MSVPDGYTPTKLIDPFEIFVGPVYDRRSEEGRRFGFRVDDRHCNLRGVLHGGMLMTFADLALGAGVWDATDFANCVTLNMQTQFMKSAHAGDWVEVLPKLVRRTRSLVFVRGDFTSSGEILMTAASVWKLLGQD